MKNYADQGSCYLTWPSASVDNILLDLHNSSHHTQPHSIIIQYKTLRLNYVLLDYSLPRSSKIWWIKFFLTTPKSSTIMVVCIPTDYYSSDFSLFLLPWNFSKVFSFIISNISLLRVLLLRQSHAFFRIFSIFNTCYNYL